MTWFGVSHLTKIFVLVISAFKDFFQNFLNVSKRSPSNFLTFCNNFDFQKAQRVPLLQFRHCDIFQKGFFCLKNLSTLYPNIVFSSPSVSACDFFLICFYRNPPSTLLENVLLEMKRLARKEDSLGFSALCDFPCTIIKNILCSVFNFLRSFVVSSWRKKRFRVLSAD